MDETFITAEMTQASSNKKIKFSGFADSYTHPQRHNIPTDKSACNNEELKGLSVCLLKGLTLCVWTDRQEVWEDGQHKGHHFNINLENTIANLNKIIPKHQ